MCASKGDDLALTDREVRLIRRYEGLRYWVALFAPLLWILVGTIYLFVTARIAQGLDTDLAGVLTAWFKKGPRYESSYPGLMVAAFDKLDGALIFYGLAIVFLPFGLLARDERRLFAKLWALHQQAKGRGEI